MNDTTNNRLFQCISKFVETICGEGLVDVVFSPGGWSTPFILAFSAQPNIQMYSILDERSAAFYALGLAKASHKPTLLLCTSGTATANYYPAIMESDSSAIPLIVITSDRAYPEHHVGVAQVTDQFHLYGNKTRYFFHADVTATTIEHEKRMQVMAKQAYHMAIQLQGTIHLNVAYSKPLEPDLEKWQDYYQNKRVYALPQKQDNIKSKVNSIDSAFYKALETSSKPLIVATYDTDDCRYYDELYYLAKALNIPIIAEPTANFSDNHIQSSLFVKYTSIFFSTDFLYKSFAPDLIIHFGGNPVMNSLEKYLSFHRDVCRFSFSSKTKWYNQSLSDATHQFLEYPPKFMIDHIKPFDMSWLEKWHTIDKKYKTCSADVLLRRKNDKLTDGYIYYSVEHKIPKEWQVFYANSLPIRDVGWFGDGTSCFRTTYVNRGQAGIDGFVSTALGITVKTQTPGIIFCGDLSFLHDSNALLSARYVKDIPLICLIVNNQGGDIFSMLPIYQFKEVYVDRFETPQDVQISFLAKAHHIPYHYVSQRSQLDKLLLHVFQSTKGFTIVELMTNKPQSQQERKDIHQYILS